MATIKTLFKWNNSRKSDIFATIDHVELINSKGVSDLETCVDYCAHPERSWENSGWHQMEPQLNSKGFSLDHFWYHSEPSD